MGQRKGYKPSPETIEKQRAALKGRMPKNLESLWAARRLKGPKPKPKCIDCGAQKTTHSGLRCKSCANSGERNPCFGISKTEEQKAKHRAAMLGDKNPWRGKRHSTETKDRCGAINKSIRRNPNNEFKAGQPPWNKDKPRFDIRGDKHPNWKGGCGNLRKVIMDSYKYKKWRREIMLRDDFSCVLCKERGGRLEVDHYPTRYSDIKNEYKIKSLDEAEKCDAMWDTNNGRTLCLECHKKTPTYLKR